VKPATVIATCALPGLVAVGVGLIISAPGVVIGGGWSALICAIAGLWAVIPLGGDSTVVQAARMGLAFGTRLVGALLVAALIGAGRADLLITLIACLLAAMAVEMVLLLRQSAHPQETARV